MKTSNSRATMMGRKSLDKTGLDLQEDTLRVSAGRRRVNKGDEDRKTNEDTTLTSFTSEDNICYKSGGE